MKLPTVLFCCCLCLRLLLHMDGALSVDPNGFVSLDCGFTGLDYTDASTTLTWKADSIFFDPTGSSADESHSLMFSVDPPTTDSTRYLQSVRYFTGNRTKYCYVFDEINAGVTQGYAYLVRASFWAGQYATAPPTGIKRISASRTFFQLYINADHWDDVVIDGSSQQSSPLVKEIYVIANYASEISVCLGGPGVNGLDSPFISALELRPLPSNMDAVNTMATRSRYLFTLHRINFGSASTTALRYPSDKLDRIWEDNREQPSLSTTEVVYSGLYETPPLEVMQTARTVAAGETELNVTLGISGNSLIKGSGDRGYFYYLYMAEITTNVTVIGQRVFDISIYDGYSYGISGQDYDILVYTENQSFTAAGWTGFWIADAYVQGSLIFSFVKSNGSVFGPQINGLELLVASENQPSAGTLARDVSALQAIKDYYHYRGAPLQSWLGDPCLPYPYNWISCNKDATPSITSLSLSHQNLTGGIPSSIVNLTSLTTLDLQGNRLSGSIPEFIATLQNLKYLWLQNNNFSGVVPSLLLEKQSSSELDLNVDGNPFLCPNSNCINTYTPPSAPTSKKSNTKFIIIGVVVGIFLLITCLLAIALCYYCRRKEHTREHTKDNCDHSRNEHGTNVEGVPVLVRNTQLAIAASDKPRAFSYVDMVTITNHFSSILGEGGFGTVYRGLLDKTIHVAVKILSKSSTQGINEFINEVTLLSRVHHRNLVRLLGYCIEKQIMLIYEYMPNGSLDKIIHGNFSHNYNLSWKDRLRILVDASEGINYLHNGCRPKIIHRDLKPANILINENMEAKISDFGISRSSYGLKEGFVNIATVKGSTYYMAPEYIQHGQIDEKTDVYAFGIVLLEVISGRPPLCRAHANDEMQYIKEWVKPLFKAGKLREIVDAKIEIVDSGSNVSSMWNVLEIAMACINEFSSSRPTTEAIVHELKSALQMEIGDTEVFNTNDHEIQAIPGRMDNLLR